MAVLLLEPNQRVPLGRLVDLLWRESPPSSARRIVQAHVSRLRHRQSASTVFSELGTPEAPHSGQLSRPVS